MICQRKTHWQHAKHSTWNTSRILGKKLATLVKNHTNIAIYASLGGEVPTDFWPQVFKKKRLLLPRLYPNTLMRMIRINGKYHKNRYGINEPVGNSISPFCIGAVIIPCVACDVDGNRLGMGKGYYDRWLADKNILCIGCCWDFQLVASIPSLPHDQKMHTVVTARHRQKPFVHHVQQQKNISDNNEL